MTWLTVLSALARIVLEMARERQGGVPAGSRLLRSPPSMRSILSARRAMRVALLPMPLLILAACATTTASVGTDAIACSAFEPIRWSERDTEETIRRVKGHNAAWAALCGRGEIAGRASSSW
jgi:hypothetical protein